MKFKITVSKKDMSVEWHSVDTGATTVVDFNRDQRLIALRTAGHKGWVNRMVGSVYTGTAFGVHSFLILNETKDELLLQIDDLFGMLNWKLRDHRMESITPEKD